MPASRKTTATKTAAKKPSGKKATGKKAAGKKPGLYANIHAKQERIAHGSGESMNKPGSAGAPSADAFAQSAKTTVAKKTRRPAAAKKAAKR